MTPRRRTKHHSATEIFEKMALAGRLSREGKQNREIANALGVSVMTYQRWKRQVATPALAASDPPQASTGVEVPRSVGANDMPPSRRGASPAEMRRIAELERENARLRRLVMDILLQKSELEDRLSDLHVSADVPGHSSRS